MDAVTVSTAYRKMKSLCLSIRNEIHTDIEIHNHNILPSFVDLPNLSSATYICSRLRAFLIACPPFGLSPPVTELVIAAKPPTAHLKIIILAGDSSNNYSMAVNSIVHNLGYPNGTVKCVAIDKDMDNFLSVADIVIYSSFLEEQSFPDILLKAMCFGKSLVAPDLSVIKKYTC